VFLLKDKLIDSRESLIELNNLLNNIAVCGAPASIDKNDFMTEVTNLKMEARRLLDEVNQNFERSPNGTRITNSSYGYENIFEAYSFKDRLNNLKQKIHALSAQNIRVK
jgi:hypothetical protein